MADAARAELSAIAFSTPEQGARMQDYFRRDLDAADGVVGDGNNFIVRKLPLN